MNRIQWLLIAGAVVTLSGISNKLLAEDIPLNLEQIEQKIKVIERKIELNEEALAENKKTLPVLQASPDGISIQAADKSFQLKLRGLVQSDGRFYIDDQNNPLTNTFLARRVRSIFEATLYRDFDAVIVPDFGSGSVVIQDAYLEFRPIAQAKLRVGKFKVPFGLERLQSDTNNKFIELALPSGLTPNRDIGLLIHGEIGDGVLSYAAGVFNGSADNSSNDGDTSDTKEVAARIFTQPFKNVYSNWINGFGFGLAATQGSTRGSLTSYRTVGQNTFATYFSTYTAEGNRSRISPQLYYYNNSFGLIAEYVLSSQEIKRRGSTNKLIVTSWQTAASYLITGEKASFNKAVSPLKPLDISKNQWGAFEIAARYAETCLDDEIFKLGIANKNASASKAFEWNTAINWYLNKGVKIALNYAQTSFEDGANKDDRETERVFLTRFQIAF